MRSRCPADFCDLYAVTLCSLLEVRYLLEGFPLRACCSATDFISKIVFKSEGKCFEVQWGEISRAEVRAVWPDFHVDRREAHLDVVSSSEPLDLHHFDCAAQRDDHRCRAYRNHWKSITMRGLTTALVNVERYEHVRPRDQTFEGAKPNKEQARKTKSRSINSSSADWQSELNTYLDDKKRQEWN